MTIKNNSTCHRAFKNGLDKKLSQAVKEQKLNGEWKDYVKFLFTQPEKDSPISTLIQEADKNPAVLRIVTEKQAVYSKN